MIVLLNTNYPNYTNIINLMGMINFQNLVVQKKQCNKNLCNTVYRLINKENKMEFNEEKTCHDHNLKCFYILASRNLKY